MSSHYIFFVLENIVIFYKEVIYAHIKVLFINQSPHRVGFTKPGFLSPEDVFVTCLMEFSLNKLTFPSI